MSHKPRIAEATLRLSPAHGPGGSAITALMELAALRLVHQGLDGTESSVGIRMSVTHAAPALASGEIRGASVRAVASYRGIAGRVHYVAIDAFDESGLIASAEHTRVIISGQSMRAGGRRRIRTRAMLLDA